MSKWDKLIMKFLSLSKDIRFDEIKKVLESYGYVVSQRSIGSSHYVFRKEGKETITIPKHKVTKLVYVMMVRDVIMEEEKYEVR